MDVILPDESPLVKTSEPQDPGFGAAVEMKTVKELVKKAVDRQIKVQFLVMSIVPLF
jgi:hypothetical protein